MFSFASQVCVQAPILRVRILFCYDYIKIVLVLVIFIQENAQKYDYIFIIIKMQNKGGKSYTACWALLPAMAVAFASQTKEANPLLLQWQSHLLRKQGGFYVFFKRW